MRNPQAVSAYFANARQHGFDLSRVHVLLVTEDHCDVPGMERLLAGEGVSGEVFDARRRATWLAEREAGAFEDLIPRKSHAETSFGLLWMMANPSFEFGMFVDDDTVPFDEHDWFGAHLANLHATAPLRTLESSTRWVNVLHEAHDRHKLYPRGYPYAAMREEYRETRERPTRVVASQGLWTDVPDLDAVRILMDGDLNGQARTLTTSSDFGTQFAAARGHYLTVCSMNLAFRREVIPAFYQLPMDDNPWRIGRFDDIWSGLFLKRAADALGGTVVTGAPLCRHLKAPRSTFKDLAAEAPALDLNEHLWKVADSAPADGAAGWDEAARALAETLEKGDFAKYSNGAFLNYVGERFRRWVDACEKLEGSA